jgi:hypothetical protein
MERGECARYGRDRDPGEDQRERAAAEPGQRLYQQGRGEGTGKRHQRQGEREGRGEPGVEREHRAEGGRARDSEQARLGQRVAQVALQRRTGEAEARADQEREQRARQADFAHHERDRLALAGQERAQALARSEAGRAGQQAEGEEREDREAEAGEGGAMGHSAAAGRTTASVRTASATSGVPQVQSRSSTTMRPPGAIARAAGWRRTSCASAGAA